MDRLTVYRQIVRQVLSKHAELAPSHGQFESIPVFDERTDQYLLIDFGWDRTGGLIRSSCMFGSRTGRSGSSGMAWKMAWPKSLSRLACRGRILCWRFIVQREGGLRSLRRIDGVGVRLSSTPFTPAKIWRVMRMTRPNGKSQPLGVPYVARSDGTLCHWKRLLNPCIPLVECLATSDHQEILCQAGSPTPRQRAGSDHPVGRNPVG